MAKKRPQLFLWLESKILRKSIIRLNLLLLVSQRSCIPNFREFGLNEQEIPGTNDDVLFWFHLNLKILRKNTKRLCLLVIVRVNTCWPRVDLKSCSSRWMRFSSHWHTHEDCSWTLLKSTWNMWIIVWMIIWNSTSYILSIEAV